MERNSMDAKEGEFKRLFILGGKGLSEDEWRSEFEKYGEINKVWITKDRQGEPKGVTYITFNKVSEAALAMEEMNGKFIYGLKKPIKVILASQPKDGSGRSRGEDEKLLRLFIIVPKGQTEDDIRKHFEEFGEIDYIRILKHRDTKMGMGLAYVKFFKPSHCAKALEECDPEYKAVVAEAEKSKHDRRSDGNTQNYYFDTPMMSTGSGYHSHREERSAMSSRSRDFASLLPQAGMYSEGPMDLINNRGNVGNDCRLEAQLIQQLTQDQVYRLFDLVPGLDFVNFNKYTGVAQIRYSSPACAEYALCKLNNFEYPPGQRISVYLPSEYDTRSGGRYDAGGMQNTMANLQSSMTNVAAGGPAVKGNLENLLQSIQEATSVLKSAGFSTADLGGGAMGGTSVMGGVAEERVRWCNVPLPIKKPFATRDAEVAERLFVVSRGDSFPDNILEDVFSRFGNLISGNFVRGRNYAYVKFADKRSAAEAIEYLNEQEIYGFRVKVMLADPPRHEDGDSRENKKMRLH